MVKAASGAVTVRALRLKLRGLGAIVSCFGLTCFVVIKWPLLPSRHELVESLGEALEACFSKGQLGQLPGIWRELAATRSHLIPDQLIANFFASATWRFRCR